ncbi:reverse transcriptase domain-containing protein [Tanacetum coccineum]
MNSFDIRFIRPSHSSWGAPVLFVKKEDHEVHLRLVLELLKKERLFAKFSKCEFWLQEVHFLGHVVDNNRIHVHPSKIEVAKNWKALKTPSEIRSFWDWLYEWGMEQKEAFQTLKDNLCNAPILSLPDGAEDFVVYCDASNQGLGYMLLQRGKVIAYALWQLKIHEKNYTTHNLELGVVVFAIKIWRHYLYGTKSVIYTDHKSLQHIFAHKELNMRQKRWIKLFSDYDCEIRYHLGKANVVADTLSRKERVKPKRVRALSITIQSGIKDKLLAAQNQAIKEENAPTEMLRSLDQQMEKKGDGGADKMYYDLRDMYWSPGMRRDIATYVSKCLTCSKVKAEHQIPSSCYNSQRYPSGNGTKSLWTLSQSYRGQGVDYSMEKSSRLYIDEIVARHRVHVSIISDRDGRFSSQFWRSLHKALGTRLDMTCLIDFGGSWDTHLPLAESPVLWAEVRENQLIGPEMVQETTDKMVIIKERLKATRDRQKSYADNRRKALEFEVGDRVLLKVSPWKGVTGFGKKGKLALSIVTSLYNNPIEAARTMLADSFLPNTFWAEAVSTACYVLNRVLVTKPHNKTPYELLTGKIPIISYIRPFGCHVTILNTIDHLGKFAGKSDEGFLVGYSLQSKAYRVYNLETKRVEENLHITFLENKPNVAGKGPTWLFDLDYLTDSMNYHPVSSENQANLHAGQQEANQNAGTEEIIDVGDSDKEDDSAQDCFVLPIWPSYSSTITPALTTDDKREGPREEEQVFMDDLERLKRQEKEANEEAEVLRKKFETLVIKEGAAKPSSTNIFSTVSTPAKASSTNLVQSAAHFERSAVYFLQIF